METTTQQTFFGKIKGFMGECVRVIHVTKKPSREEFKAIVKVSGLGMLIIGFIGFVIQMIKTLLFQ